MDPLPQVPRAKGINDTVHVIRNTFEEKLEDEVFPLDIANNLRTYGASENFGLRENANKVFGIYRSLEEESECIKCTEYDIIKQHVDFIFAKNVIEKDEFLREMMKLKTHDIFADIYLPDKFRYGVIQKSDLYPDATRQFLDFRFNTSLHQCKRCFSKENMNYLPEKPLERTRQHIPGIKEAKKPFKKVSALRLEPAEIFFKNFELKVPYEQTFKIKNISSQMQQLSIVSYPKLSVFTLEFDVGRKIAPGMYVTGTIKFYPEIFTNLQDNASFISRKGETVNVPIRCHRDPPKLTAFVQKSTDYPDLGTQSAPGYKEFSIKRQKAVNNTIDCGTCFVTEHIMVSITFVNTGNKARFFWLSEENFCFQEVNTVSTNLEITKDCFWIYPTYFEILEGCSCEINIIFQPLYCGLQAQTFYLMCDNNTFQQIELVGDGVCFNKNMITVEIPFLTKEIEKKDGHCIFLGHIMRSNEKSSFTLSITNLSSVFCKYSLTCKEKDGLCTMYQWIKVINVTPDFLAPYSTTDIIYEMECPVDIPKGYYNTKLMLFIRDIPIASLESEEVFLISTNGKPLRDITNNMSVVDILIMEVEIACYIDPQIEQEIKSLVECESCGNLDCLCTVCKEIIPPADLEFDQPFLEFGILPVGVDVKKDFNIINLGRDQLKWTIVEMKYNIDSPPYLEVVKEKTVSSYRGICHPNKKNRLTYKIEKKSPARYVSMLVLFLVKDDLDDKDSSNFVAQNICVVSYEITELNIVIQTGQSKEPILCPMQMLYTGVPVDISFKIQNCSLIPGCFYFLKPTGSDADKIMVKYKPKSGALKSGSKRTITLTLTCYDVGILENIYLPCFIGTYQEPIRLRLLCVVDCIHLFFYLPTKNNNFEKILWPPKVIFENDVSWSNYCMCEEFSNAEENTINSIKSEHEMKIMKRSDDTLKDIRNSKMSITNATGTATATELYSDESSSQDILKILVNADPQIFIQECVMEVRRVTAKEPKKVTIYFENVTPKLARYTIQSTNYPSKKDNLKACLGPKYQKIEDLWEPMIQDHGIVVHPNAESLYIKPHELVSVDVWIYARTWGIYAEEIIVDIENIASFSFSLIIEVVGCPLQLPIGIGPISKYPIIRLGSVTFESEAIIRDVIIRNVSSVDVTVSWHVFYANEDNEDTDPFNFICDIVDKSEEHFEFNFTERYFGREGFECIEIQPRRLMIEYGSQLTVPIIFKPYYAKCHSKKCQINCFIVGRIFPNENDRLKSNYFYRKPNSVVMEVTAALEMPRLDIEVEEETLRIYANDIAVKRQTDYYIKLIVRNPTSSTITFNLDVGEPFSLAKFDDEIVIDPGKCKEIHLPCIIPYEKIIKWAPYVYRLTEVIKDVRPSAPEMIVRKFEELKLIPSDDKIIDDENKIMKFHKKLFLLYKGGFHDVIPINIYIYYPNITVKPSHVKFGYLLLGRTQKTTISVYNLTGSNVLFEIFKTTSTQELVVIPSNGEIQKSTGVNHNFTTITIFFTPTESRTYHESIRIVTNIPQCYIDIPVKGTGSVNEKFNR